MSVLYVLRRATVEDIPAIASLWVEMTAFHAACDARFRPHPDGPDNWTKTLAEWIERDDMAVFVADAAGRVVGYTIAMDRESPPVLLPSRYGFVSDLAVTVSWRRRGVATALLKAAIAWFKERGLPEFRLNVANQNAVSNAFWQSMGLQPYMQLMWSEVK